MTRVVARLPDAGVGDQLADAAGALDKAIEGSTPYAGEIVTADRKPPSPSPRFPRR